MFFIFFCWEETARRIAVEIKKKKAFLKLARTLNATTASMSAEVP